jgi:two-component system chemotaxis response regulator CheY
MSKRLLIVDDAVIMRMRIREIAREAGWTVVGEAANGQEAVARFRELNPDLVTLDIVMPVKDGVTALREIRQEHPQARIIMVSAGGDRFAPRPSGLDIRLSAHGRHRHDRGCG